MVFFNNSTNAFGCDYTLDLERLVIWNNAQGYTNLSFGFVILLFIIYFIYLLIKLLKISFTTFTKFMIALNVIILITLGLSVYTDCDFSLYCISGLKIEFTFPTCAILAMTSIFLFDYIICDALKAPLLEERQIQEELVYKISIIFKVRLPLLIIYILLIVGWYFLFICKLQIFEIFFYISSFYSFFYLFIYCYFLMNSMNFYGHVIRRRNNKLYDQVYPQLLFTKIAIGAHFFSEILWLSSVQIYRIFSNDWFGYISDYCFKNGCLWANASLFVFYFLAYYLLFLAFGIFILQFTNIEISAQRISIENLYLLESRSLFESIN